MSKVDKMFEDLGFTKIENDYFIKYNLIRLHGEEEDDVDEEGYEMKDEVLCEFDKREHTYRYFLNVAYDPNPYPLPIDIKMNMIIQLKLEELEWNNE